MKKTFPKEVVLVAIWVLVTVGVIVLTVLTLSEEKELPTTPTETVTTPCPTIYVEETEEAEEISDEELIWNIIYEGTKSEIATAAIMGNLSAESGLCPWRYENYDVDKSAEINAVRRKNKQKFIYSELGYGLAGWTYTTNLERLWNWCEEHGYDVDSVEGQARFVVEDYKNTEPNSYARLIRYGSKDIVVATEDFRQSYEQSICQEYSQYRRCKLAKIFYARYADVSTQEIIDVADAPYHYDIVYRVQQMNAEIANERH